jgi:hypothetical protein
MDRLAWRELGFSEQFAQRQEAVIAAYARLGVTPTCTCTPYQVGYTPDYGQHVAWAESSAVSYANSVLGARTNREGGPSALAAAITGRTARYGLHLDSGREATALVVVRCQIRSEADLGVLGYLVGQKVKNGVPYFRFEHGESQWGRGGTLRPIGQRVAAYPAGDLHPEAKSETQSGNENWPEAMALKTLGAAMAASGAVALYHIEGVTPEAVAGLAPGPNIETLVVDDLTPGYAALNSAGSQIDLVSLGCPHASLSEVEAVADYLHGRQLKAALWITTARAIRDAAETAGLVARIEAAGGQVVADTCLVVAPVAELRYRAMATNSAKMAFYTPSHSGLTVRFGPLEQCLEAAITGKWPEKYPSGFKGV